MKLAHSWPKNKYIRDDDDADCTDDERSSTGKRNLQRTPSASSQKTDDSAETPSTDKSRFINVLLFLHYCALSIIFQSCNVL